MTQKDAIRKMLSGANIFLTGPPGSGKTYTLNQYIDIAYDRDMHVAITASTGIAASHIGGVTIHSWAGIGIADAVTKELMQKIERNKRLVKRYRRTDVLVIDEVSMLHGKRLDMVNMIAKALRGNNRPFGGIQVILVGDLYQLPPVNRESAELDFVHHSYAWKDLDPQICYITEQHRQASDDPLLGILHAMRNQAVDDEHMQLLRNRDGVESDNLTRLYSHNVDVDAINDAKLAALKGKPRNWKMQLSGNPMKVEQLVRNVLAPQELSLKVGAEVMFVANNFDAGFYNGTRGKVVGFSKKGGNPIIETNGRRIRVERHSWKMTEDDEVVAEVEQIPLRLAWAITIHKSQGMSLDAALVDLSKAFTPGMGYVALSRVRSLDGLYIAGMNDMAMLMHDEIHELDAVLRNKSGEK